MKAKKIRRRNRVASNDGLGLRDRFAIEAFKILLQRSDHMYMDVGVKRSYELADAALSERET